MGLAMPKSKMSPVVRVWLCNVLHRLMNLNAWSPACGNVLRDYGTFAT